MGSQMFQLLILAVIAVFLIIKLRNVLGTRDGFEPDWGQVPDMSAVEETVDNDILEHAEEGSDTANALFAMKDVDPNFSVNEFLGGARAAYEMIVMAFENGNLEEVTDFISDDVTDLLQSVIDTRADQGLVVEANFIGMRELSLKSARFDDLTKQAEIDVKFVAEMTSLVKNQDGDVIEGSNTDIKRQRDTWTFTRDMHSDSPNWTLTATDE